MGKPYSFICVECRKVFTAKRKFTKVCSEACRKARDKKADVIRPQKPRIDSFSYGTVYTLENMEKPFEE